MVLETRALHQHLSIIMDCQYLAENGMPTAGESHGLNLLEDTISEALQLQRNALFVARYRMKHDLKWNLPKAELEHCQCPLFFVSK